MKPVKLFDAKEIQAMVERSQKYGKDKASIHRWFDDETMSKRDHELEQGRKKIKGEQASIFLKYHMDMFCQSLQSQIKNSQIADKEALNAFFKRSCKRHFDLSEREGSIAFVRFVETCLVEIGCKIDLTKWSYFPAELGNISLEKMLMNFIPISYYDGNVDEIVKERLATQRKSAADARKAKAQEERNVMDNLVKSEKKTHSIGENLSVAEAARRLAKKSDKFEDVPLQTITKSLRRTGHQAHRTGIKNDK